MGIIYGLRNSYILLWYVFVLSFYQVNSRSNVFNLKKYGGVSSVTFDNTKALKRAWNDACQWKGKVRARLVIPHGNYLVSDVQLVGPCKGSIVFINRGRLLATPGLTDLGHWIDFRYLDGLIIDGGFYDGQGNTVWDRSNLMNPGYAILNLAFVNNTNIQNVHLINSKKNHISIFGCNNLKVSRSTISAPKNSPNTDGIKMAVSDNIRVTDVTIASGDDCVSMLRGSHNVNITRVRCGPGHGISIGSMGSDPGDVVKQVSVTNCNFTGTSNGIRIKSWATTNFGICSGVSFQDIVMKDVYNPILIDQNYCPRKNCPKGDSHVQIKGINFMNIKGTSASNVGIDLQCSSSNPCENVRLENINLTYHGRPTTPLCSNVKVVTTSLKNTGSCFLHK